ncbi:zinc finger-like domain-containing protein [Burkholderia gladioli]|uniref:zinc finger-like domain-containing protein n=1 Tax=Burkholderia gladioli TaxID=28095 RepID=UPI00163EF074|nr:zinc finger-like domain-containing protein [Burkholderia gladioli]
MKNLEVSIVFLNETATISRHTNIAFLGGNLRGETVIREKIVSATQSSNLRWDAEYERAVDRLTALGHADKLGSALIRAKYLNDAGSALIAVSLLAQRCTSIRKGMQIGYAMQLSRVAFFEWIVDMCDHCNGTGIRDGVSCSKCNGTGARQHSDYERAMRAEIEVGDWPNHQRSFDAVTAALQAAVGRTQGKVRSSLGEET